MNAVFTADRWERLSVWEWTRFIDIIDSIVYRIKCAMYFDFCFLPEEAL